MRTTAPSAMTTPIITSAELLEHWQGHRRLTRKLIELFPDKDFFEYAIGGMRTTSQLIEELLSIAVPGLRQIATGTMEEQVHHIDFKGDKKFVLELWDRATDEINEFWGQISDQRFREEIVTFGQYPGTVWSSILYFIDNEIHHRGQVFVYLRALGLEPPFFWER